MMMMMMNRFVVWLTDERCLVLFPAGTIVRDPRYRESLTRREQDQRQVLSFAKLYMYIYINYILYIYIYMSVRSENIC